MSEKHAEQVLADFEKFCNEVPKELDAYPKLRQRALEVANRTHHALEKAWDRSFRLTWSALDLVALKVALDLNLFKILSDHSGPMSFAEISKKIDHVDTSLLRRVLMYLDAVGMLDHPEREVYVANDFTREATTPGREGNIEFTFVAMNSWIALPEFLAKTKYQDPVNALDCPWQIGANNKQNFWEYLKDRPSLSKNFNDWMTSNRPTFEANLGENFGAEELFKGSGPEDILMVDVGGGNGQNSLSLRNQFPKERGRIIVQDLPEVVEGVKLKDVEVMAHDMFTPQPIVGAYTYFFRGIIHDHADHVCRKFLEQTVKAMKPYSRLLVTDILLPDTQPDERSVQQDFMMMCCFAARERTVQDMKELLASVGLKVVGTHEYQQGNWRITEAALA